MGYGVHITRDTERSSVGSESIGLSEWLSVIENDPELKRHETFRTQNPQSGQVIEIPSEGLAEWVGWSKHKSSGDHAYLDFNRGRISAKNPDSELLGKMKAIAALLRANVLGDEGESYGQ